MVGNGFGYIQQSPKDANSSILGKEMQIGEETLIEAGCCSADYCTITKVAELRDFDHFMA